MKGYRIGLLVGLLAVPLACLALSCKSSSFGSVESGAEKTGPAGPTTPAALVSQYDALAEEILATRKKEVQIVESVLKAAYSDATVSLGKARAAIKAGDRKAAQGDLEDLAAAVGFLGTEGDGSCARVRKRLVEGGHHYNPAAGSQDPGHAAHHAEQQGKHHAKGEAGAPPPAHHAAPGAEGKAEPGAPATKDAGHHAQPGADGNAKAPEGHAKQGPEHHAHADGAGGFDLGYVVVNRGAKKSFLDESRAIAQLSTAPDAAALDREWAKVETTWTALWKTRK
jgi:hypothetical protein